MLSWRLIEKLHKTQVTKISEKEKTFKKKKKVLLNW